MKCQGIRDKIIWSSEKRGENVQIQLSSMGHDIVASGMAYLFDKDADLTMDIEADGGYRFRLVMKFEEDSDKEQGIEQNVRDNTIFLTCCNFIEAGTGLYEPVQIAIVNGKALFLVFWSYLDGTEKGKRKMRSVRYTLFY